jgi:hypothetical protein
MPNKKMWIHGSPEGDGNDLSAIFFIHCRWASANG